MILVLINSVKMVDIVKRTNQEQWLIGMTREKDSTASMQLACIDHDDDADNEGKNDSVSQ